MIISLIHRKKNVKVVTQQYKVGLYVAVYFAGNPLPEQLSLDVSEADFHRDVRAGKFFRGKITVLPDESTPL